jgi:transposase
MKRRELTIEERNKIIGAYQCGTAPATIARTLGFPATTVYGTIDRYRKTGTAQPKTRPGRPPSLDDRDQRVLKRIVLAGRRKPLGEITNETNARLNTSLSPNTIRKYMAKAGFSNRRARKKPLLSEKTSKPDWGGVKSARNGTRSGRRWSSRMNRASVFSTPTDG